MYEVPLNKDNEKLQTRLELKKMRMGLSPSFHFDAHSQAGKMEGHVS